MPKIRGNPAEKWARRASAAQTDYVNGITNPKQDWAQATQQAENAYQQGIQQALQRKAWTKGIQKAGTEKWRRKAQELGSQRYPQGVQVAAPDYEAGIKPYLDTISSITLPPRGPKGDPRNLDRVRIIAEALRKKKIGG